MVNIDQKVQKTLKPARNCNPPLLDILCYCFVLFLEVTDENCKLQENAVNGWKVPQMARK